MELDLFARYMKKKRLSLQYSQLECANRMGYQSKTTYGRLENGQTNITLAQAFNFATNVLEIEPTEMFMEFQSD